ncbi:MAG TPA: ComEC/Rec2 family competence protein [Pyrinomonadaceae bacterium]|nr:ComEC/Rec2 family competence protein [Pyrinomonadaceae bacterium]
MTFRPFPEQERKAQARSGCLVLGVILSLLAIAVICLLILGYFWLAKRTPRPAPQPAPSGDELQVHVLDVGQGDSILIVAPGGKTVLVDAGVPGSGKVVTDAMTRYGLKQIDMMVASHAHADHIGGADEVIRATKVVSVLDSQVPNTTRNYEDFLKAIKEGGVQYVAASPGQNFDMGGGAKLTVLAPIKPFFTKDQLRSGANEPNANSVVVRLDYGDFSMLLTGDAEAETEARMMKAGANVRAKVLKVGHHGSRYASSEEFLRAGGFEAALISDGEDNRYGHPSQEALDRFKRLGIKVYRTDLQGEITIKTRGQGYEIQTARAATGDLWTGRTAQKSEPQRGDVDTETQRSSRRGSSGR